MAKKHLCTLKKRSVSASVTGDTRQGDQVGRWESVGSPAACFIASARETRTSRLEVRLRLAEETSRKSWRSQAPRKNDRSNTFMHLMMSVETSYVTLTDTPGGGEVGWVGGRGVSPSIICFPIPLSPLTRGIVFSSLLIPLFTYPGTEHTPDRLPWKRL